MPKEKEKQKIFTPYQVMIICILAFLQFTIILDFMVLSPLSAILLPALKIAPAQFSLVVSAYLFSAGTSGLLFAGFADRFDRKKILLFFYGGFIIGTFLCGIAGGYWFLLFARIVTGLFGGVIGSVVFAITIDLFDMQVRGRVMGFIQMAFSVSQVLGIPVGLSLANNFDWHAPFIMIASVSVVVYFIVLFKMRSISEHLKIKKDKTVYQHFAHTVSKRRYLFGFAATSLLATGGFMLMPFGSAFAVNNLKIDIHHLTPLYTITGVVSLIAGPIVGKLSDRVGKYSMFLTGTILSMIMVLIYCNLSETPLYLVIIINSILFLGITSRMVSASALTSAVPGPADRGAYMGINASVQQLSGGLAAFIAGLIVIQEPGGKLEHYNILALVVVGAMMVTAFLMYRIHKIVTVPTPKDTIIHPVPESA